MLIRSAQQKEQTIRQKRDEFDYMKIKDLCLIKSLDERMGEDISRLYRKPLKSTGERAMLNKMGKGYEHQFLEEESLSSHTLKEVLNIFSKQ